MVSFGVLCLRQNDPLFFGCDLTPPPKGFLLKVLYKEVGPTLDRNALLWKSHLNYWIENVQIIRITEFICENQSLTKPKIMKKEIERLLKRKSYMAHCDAPIWQNTVPPYGTTQCCNQELTWLTLGLPCCTLRWRHPLCLYPSSTPHHFRGNFHPIRVIQKKKLCSFFRRTSWKS